MERKVAFVIGLLPQGLTMIRLLGAAGWDIKCFYPIEDASRGEYRYCKYLRGGRATCYRTDEELLELMNEAARKVNPEKLQIFITSADALSSLSMNHRELWQQYSVQSNPLEVLDLLTDKCKMYSLAHHSGIETAPYCMLDDYAEGALTYPVVVKRNREIPGMMEYKCVKIGSTHELMTFARNTPPNIRRYLMLQECIKDDFVDLDMRGYVHEGRLKGYAVVKEIRAYPEGVPSYLEEISDSNLCTQIGAKIGKMLEKTSYTGFIGIDMKYRNQDAKLYILDVNPRTPASISSWVMKYRFKDLRYFFQYLDNPPQLVPVNQHIKWVNLQRDFTARRLNNDWRGLWKTMTAKWDIWSWRDPLPFIMWPWCFISRKLNKMQ